MRPFALLGSDPVEGEFVSFGEASLEFIDAWPSVEFKSCSEVFIFFSLVSPGKKPWWTGTRFFGQVKCVKVVNKPIIVSEAAFLSPEKISVGLAELEKIVEGPLSSGIEHFNTQLPDIVVDGPVGFNSTEPVEGPAISLLHSMVIRHSQGLGQDLGVNWSLILEVEPEFSFASGGKGISFLAKGLLEVDSTVAGLDVGLDSEELFVHEIVLQDRVGVLVECGKRLVFVWSGFWHQKF